MDKHGLRSEMKKRTAEISPEAKASRSAAMFGQVEKELEAIGARVVAMYSALPDEPPTAEALERLSRRYEVLLPRVDGDDMEFFPYRTGEMGKGAFGIMEPKGTTPVPPDRIDAMVVPGRAFTADGMRLGRGRGYYDRYLSRKGFRALKIGICFSQQIVDRIPAEEHDVRMDRIVHG